MMIFQSKLLNCQSEEFLFTRVDNCGLFWPATMRMSSTRWMSIWLKRDRHGDMTSSSFTQHMFRYTNILVVLQMDLCCCCCFDITECLRFSWHFQDMSASVSLIVFVDKDLDEWLGIAGCGHVRNRHVKRRSKFHVKYYMSKGEVNFMSSTIVINEDYSYIVWVL